MLPTIINIISLASIFLCIAIGLNIIFGVMGVINFAHGEFLMIGSYVTYTITKILPGTVGFFLAIPFSFLITASIGGLTEWLLIRRVYSRPYEGILVTWSLGLLLQQLARNIFGASNVDVVIPAILQGGIAINHEANSYQIPLVRIFIFALVVCTIILVYLFIYKTHIGVKIQAVMQNSEMASCMGIAIRKVHFITFFIGCGVAGIAGVGVALLGSIGPSTGQHYIINSFLVVVVGGVGTLAGTIFGASFMGVMSPLLESYTSSTMSQVSLYLIIIVVLRFKPSGFITRKIRSHG